MTLVLKTSKSEKIFKGSNPLSSAEIKKRKNMTQPSLNPLFYLNKVPYWIPYVSLIIASLQNLSIFGIIIQFIGYILLWVCVDMILTIVPYLKKLPE